VVQPSGAKSWALRYRRTGWTPSQADAWPFGHLATKRREKEALADAAANSFPAVARQFIDQYAAKFFFWPRVTQACASHCQDLNSRGQGPTSPAVLSPPARKADVYFENVSGAIFEAVFPLLNPFARVPVCGLISMYNATSLSPGPILLPRLTRAILTKRLTFRGFIVSDFFGR
jgi:hypothetical protein